MQTHVDPVPCRWCGSRRAPPAPVPAHARPGRRAGGRRGALDALAELDRRAGSAPRPGRTAIPACPLTAACSTPGFQDQLGRGEVTDSMLHELAGMGDERALPEAVRRYRDEGCTRPLVGSFAQHAGRAGFEASLEAAIG
jgi:hypothetical protein